MKAWTGYIELIIIMVFIIAGVPLFLALVYTCNKSSFNYLADKTIYNISNNEGMYLASDGRYYPVAMLPIRVDYGGAIAMALVQDNYCPAGGNNLAYAYNTDIINSEFFNASPPEVVDPTVNGNGAIWGSVKLVDGWQGHKLDAFDSIKNRIDTEVIRNTWSNQRLFLAYNYKEKAWMITAQRISSFSVR